MTVAKFGGTLLDGAEGLRRVCGEIRSLDTPLLVVVSAFADVTNRLEHIAAAATDDAPRARRELEALDAWHHAIARDALTEQAYAGWRHTVEPFMARLGEVVEGLAIVRDLSPRTLDLVVHFGERLSSALVTAALGDVPGTNVAGLSALDIIITQPGHRYARPDIELTRERVESLLRPALAAHDIVVTEGYIARSTTGQAATMGRESSNYSATLLAELLGASSVTIYTSVPGILTADPALIPTARTIERISYRMATALAELGAKVLHPRTVLPAERAGIPLVISGIGGGSTVIGHEGADARSIVMLHEATLITVETPAVSTPVEPFLRAVSAAAPLVWFTRFRRRLQAVAAAGHAQTEASTAAHAGLLGEGSSVTSRAVSLVSLVREQRLDGEDMSMFIAAIGEAPVGALLGSPETGAVGSALEPGDAAAVLRELHRLFVDSRKGAAEWQAA